jgi:hypothetical protein
MILVRRAVDMIHASISRDGLYGVSSRFMASAVADTEGDWPFTNRASRTLPGFTVRTVRHAQAIAALRMASRLLSMPDLSAKAALMVRQLHELYAAAHDSSAATGTGSGEEAKDLLPGQNPGKWAPKPSPKALATVKSKAGAKAAEAKTVTDDGLGPFHVGVVIGPTEAQDTPVRSLSSELPLLLLFLEPGDLPDSVISWLADTALALQTPVGLRTGRTAPDYTSTHADMRRGMAADAGVASSFQLASGLAPTGRRTADREVHWHVSPVEQAAILLGVSKHVDYAIRTHMLADTDTDEDSDGKGGSGHGSKWRARNRPRFMRPEFQDANGDARPDGGIEYGEEADAAEGGGSAMSKEEERERESQRQAGIDESDRIAGILRSGRTGEDGGDAGNKLKPKRKQHDKAHGSESGYHAHLLSNLRKLADAALHVGPVLDRLLQESHTRMELARLAAQHESDAIRKSSQAGGKGAALRKNDGAASDSPSDLASRFLLSPLVVRDASIPEVVSEVRKRRLHIGTNNTDEFLASLSTVAHSFVAPELLSFSSRHSDDGLVDPRSFAPFVPAWGLLPHSALAPYLIRAGESVPETAAPVESRFTVSATVTSAGGIRKAVSAVAKDIIELAKAVANYAKTKAKSFSKNKNRREEDDADQPVAAVPGRKRATGLSLAQEAGAEVHLFYPKKGGLRVVHPAGLTADGFVLLSGDDASSIYSKRQQLLPVGNKGKAQGAEAPAALGEDVVALKERAIPLLEHVAVKIAVAHDVDAPASASKDAQQDGADSAGSKPKHDSKNAVQKKLGVAEKAIGAFKSLRDRLSKSTETITVRGDGRPSTLETMATARFFRRITAVARGVATHRQARLEARLKHLQERRRRIAAGEIDPSDEDDDDDDWESDSDGDGERNVAAGHDEDQLEREASAEIEDDVRAARGQGSAEPKWSLKKALLGGARVRVTASDVLLALIRQPAYLPGERGSLQRFDRSDRDGDGLVVERGRVVFLPSVADRFVWIDERGRRAANKRLDVIVQLIQLRQMGISVPQSAMLGIRNDARAVGLEDVLAEMEDKADLQSGQLEHLQQEEAQVMLDEAEAETRREEELLRQANELGRDAALQPRSEDERAALLAPAALPEPGSGDADADREEGHPKKLSKPLAPVAVALPLPPRPEDEATDAEADHPLGEDPEWRAAQEAEKAEANKAEAKAADPADAAARKLSEDSAPEVAQQKDEKDAKKKEPVTGAKSADAPLTVAKLAAAAERICGPQSNRAASWFGYCCIGENSLTSLSKALAAQGAPDAAVDPTRIPKFSCSSVIYGKPIGMSCMAIDDDYCDCDKDGFDEPSTGACAQTPFRCPDGVRIVERGAETLLPLADYQSTTLPGAALAKLTPADLAKFGYIHASKVGDGIEDCAGGADEKAAA